MIPSSITPWPTGPGVEAPSLPRPHSGHVGGRMLGRLLAIARDELPSDVRGAEVTIAACFRASLALNVLLGGEADMTFSARCHLERTRRRGVLARGFWAGLTALIDVLCAVLRGECEHCATAWANHLGRGRAA